MCDRILCSIDLEKIKIKVKGKCKIHNSCVELVSFRVYLVGVLCSFTLFGVLGIFVSLSQPLDCFAFTIFFLRKIYNV